MTKRMLIDASHSEETRVVVLDGNRLEEFDVETENKKPLKGNIYLAKVVRVEPSLQAAFVEYGGNRHGFLAFGEIHPDYYQIPVADREKLLALQAQEADEDEDEDEVSDAEAEAMAEAIERFADADPRAAAPQPEAASGAPAEAGPPSTFSESHEPEHPRSVDPDQVTPRSQPMAAADESRSATPEELGGSDLPPNGDDEDEEEGPPPETIGGRGRSENGDSDDRAERRIPPRFLRHYKIQEVIRRRQIMLVQVVKEERGNKGAALTTYISLAGRFSVLMPNSPKGGGISRKITSVADRKRLREVIQDLRMPRGMSMIVRTAGAGRPKPEIRRDCEYLLQLWDDIRERTLQSTAPALIYEEADLIKRSIRDVFGSGIEDIQIEGEDAFRQARDFMRMLMPQNERKIRLYRDASVPLFARHGVDSQLDAMMSPTVQLKSGGYLVINQTEALVAIDVNSGRATRDRHIEDTALRTNLEAADEVARQLRLRDLAGLIVIDFIDMESSRHDAQVERRLKEALKHDRARIQVGRISHFGLLEMSRQRLRPSLTEHSFITCAHCQGLGIVRSPESAALQVLRQIEEEGAKRRAAEICVHIAPDLAIHLLNRRRDRLSEIEARYNMAVQFRTDDSLLGPAIRIERLRAQTVVEAPSGPAALRMDYAPEAEQEEVAVAVPEAPLEAEAEVSGEAPAANGEPPAEGEAKGDERGDGRRRRRRRRRRGGRREDGLPQQDAANEGDENGEDEEADETDAPDMAAATDAVPVSPQPSPREEERREGGEGERGLRRRSRRGNRRRPWEAEAQGEVEAPAAARYAGPTPADPFGGTLEDIFDAMAAAEEAAEQPPATPPSLPPVSAEVAPVLPVSGTPAEADPMAPAVEVAATPVQPELPVEEAPQAPAEAVSQPAADPEAAPEDAPAKPRRTRATRSKKAAEAPADAAAEGVAEAKPRRTRSKKAAAEAVPAEVEAEAAAEPAPAPKPRRTRSKKAAEPVAAAAEAVAAPVEPAPEPAAAPVPPPVAEDAVVAGAPEPVADPALAAPAEPVASAPVQPVLIDAAPDAPKKRGWWKR
ncbi:ribonuclease E/G [Teichococcus oryzae]|uniref:Ribonuclease E n=1 Tax=Teichococcus oryzae TaxID=1608942 RepID=A0A5B2TJ92_9PROT|nr:ribonuclease E/G [Pseudoroseomonas oryzae]KAA2214551.1 Rne/Rng family ribonuclease [Pseudoroseomonas oryzae]